ncbi:hypothetical protein ABC337_16835 [Arthrobacter sp. 1P04PC]|uniref:hypothetical protein n=1 Tax=unclassified Arthrobacter TaxID=235627 RepID=UPI0039A215B2
MTATISAGPGAPEVDVRNADLIRLIAGVAAADKPSLEGFYALTSARCYGLIRQVVPEAPAAQAVLENVYASVWKRARTYKPADGTPIAWALSLAYGHAMQARAHHGLSATGA